MGDPSVRSGLIFVAVVGLPASCGPGHPAVQSPYLIDPRLPLVVEFFRTAQSPAAALAEDFLSAADRNRLDWRLLPSICYVETSGGKRAANNNLFGWESGRQRFTSTRAGIHAVARRLAISNLYKEKDLRSKLQTYNPRPRYATRVETVMRRLGPADPYALRPEVARPGYSSMRTPK